MAAEALNTFLIGTLLYALCESLVQQSNTCPAATITGMLLHGGVAGRSIQVSISPTTSSIAWHGGGGKALLNQWEHFWYEHCTKNTSGLSPWTFIYFSSVGWWFSCPQKWPLIILCLMDKGLHCIDRIMVDLICCNKGCWGMHSALAEPQCRLVLAPMRAPPTPWVPCTCCKALRAGSTHVAGDKDDRIGPFVNNGLKHLKSLWRESKAQITQFKIQPLAHLSSATLGKCGVYFLFCAKTNPHIYCKWTLSVTIILNPI